MWTTPFVSSLPSSSSSIIRSSWILKPSIALPRVKRLWLFETSTDNKQQLLCRQHFFSVAKKWAQGVWYQQQIYGLIRSRKPAFPVSQHGTCNAFTTLIGCSSPRAWMQCWNKQLMLSFIFINSSPSRASSLPSRYSRLTCQVKKQFMHVIPSLMP